MTVVFHLLYPYFSQYKSDLKTVTDKFLTSPIDVYSACYRQTNKLPTNGNFCIKQCKESPHFTLEKTNDTQCSLKLMERSATLEKSVESLSSQLYRGLGNPLF